MNLGPRRSTIYTLDLVGCNLKLRSVVAAPIAAAICMPRSCTHKLRAHYLASQGIWCASAAGHGPRMQENRYPSRLTQKGSEEREMLGAVILSAKKRPRMPQHCVFNVRSASQKIYHLALLKGQSGEQASLLSTQYAVEHFCVAFQNLATDREYCSKRAQKASTPLIHVTAC